MNIKENKINFELSPNEQNPSLENKIENLATAKIEQLKNSVEILREKFTEDEIVINLDNIELPKKIIELEEKPKAKSLKASTRALAKERSSGINIDNFLPKTTEEDPKLSDNPCGYHYEDHETVELNSGDLRYEYVDFNIPGINGMDLEVKRVYRSAKAMDKTFTHDAKKIASLFFYLYPMGCPSSVLEIGGPFANSSVMNDHRQDAVEEWGGSKNIAHSYENKSRLPTLVTSLRDNNQYLLEHKLGIGWQFAFPSIETLPNSWTQRGHVMYRDYLNLGDGAMHSIVSGKLEDHKLEDFTFAMVTGYIPFPDGSDEVYVYKVTFKNGNEYFFNKRNIVAMKDRFGNQIRFRFHNDGINIWDTLNRLTKLEKYNVSSAETYNLRWVLPDGRTMNYSVQDNLLKSVSDFENQTSQYSYETIPVSARLHYEYSGDEGQTANAYMLTNIIHPTGANTIYKWKKYTEQVPENIDHGKRYREKIVLSYRCDAEITRGQQAQRNLIGYGYGFHAKNIRKDKDDKSREPNFEYYICETIVNDPARETITSHEFSSDHLRMKEIKKVSDKVVSDKTFQYNENKLLVRETTELYGSSTQTIVKEWSYDNKGNLLSSKDALGNVVTMTYHHYSLPETKKEYLDYGKTKLLETRYALDVTRKAIGTVELFENNLLKKKNAMEYSNVGNLTVNREYNASGSLLRTTEYSYQNQTLPNKITVDGLSGAFTEYDLLGKKTKITDPNGNITSYERDNLGRVVFKTNPDGGEKQYLYDVDSSKNENTVWIVNECGNKSYIEYTPLGKVSQVTDVTNKSIISVHFYDEVNRVSAEYSLDEGKYVKALTEYTFDHADRPISKKVQDFQKSTPLGSEAYSYDNVVEGKFAKAVKTVNGDANSPSMTTVEYKDVLGRVVKSGVVIGGNEQLDVSDYDTRGNKTNLKTALDSSKGFEYSKKWDYDYAGQVVREYSARVNGSVPEVYASFEYDELGNKTRSIDFNGNEIKFYYDSLGRMTKQMSQFDGSSYATTLFQYDNVGNMTEQKVQSNKQSEAACWKRTTYNYSNRNLLTDTRTYLDDGNSNFEHIHYDYDKMGNRTAEYIGVQNGTLATAKITRYAYNDYGKITRITDPMGKSDYFTYNEANLLVSKEDKNGIKTNYTYDALDRVLTETESKNNTVNKTGYTFAGAVSYIENAVLKISYIYDEAGRLITETDSNGVAKVYQYDIGGNRTSFKLTQNGSLLVNMGYIYDHENRLQTVLKDNSTIAQYYYDANGNRTSLIYTGTGITTNYAYNKANFVTSLVNKAGSSVRSQYAYTYYLDGNQATKTEAGRVIEYTYDRVGRLTKESGGGQTQSYTYDRFFNRTTMVASGNESYNVNYNYNACNQLTDSVEVRGGVTTSTIYTYDKNGNEIACKKTGGVVSNKAMVYNGLNKLVTATVDGTTTSYNYRPDGLRHNKVNGSNTTIHLWSGQNIVAELSGTGAVKGRYFRGIGLIAQQIDSNTQYYLFNAHGDIVQRTSANGTLLKSYDYDAFGVEKLEEPLDQNPFRYCGEYFDKETQTIYLRARSYNPRTGRFTAQDPARDGLNWYTYCGGNPLMFVDPSGLDAILVDKVVDNFVGIEHMGGFFQDENDDWFFFSWGTDVKYHKVTDTSIFESMEKINKYLYKNNLYDKENKPYIDSVYIKGDFTESNKAAKKYFDDYDSSLKSWDGDGLSNQEYKFFTKNCGQVTMELFMKGKLSSGTSVKDYMKENGYSNATIPNWNMINMQSIFYNKSTNIDEFNEAIKQQQDKYLEGNERTQKQYSNLKKKIDTIK